MRSVRCSGERQHYHAPTLRPQNFAHLKNSAAAVQKEYDKIMSWADLYAGSSIEGKKMILRQLIDRVNIGRDFEIEVEF